jgi:putative Holliday junction resolvase
MPLVSIQALQDLRSQKQPLMGLDVGDKTIGLALSDRDLIALLKEHQVCGCIVGLPMNMDGSEGPRCQSVRQFVKNLMAFEDIPICFWDERLSTVAVTNTMLSADLSRQRRAQLVDKLAASYILQGALDRFQQISH